MGQSGHMSRGETIASLTRLAREVRPILEQRSRAPAHAG
jgi:hypothetical protein